MNVRTQCSVCASTSLREMPFGYQYNGRWLGGISCRQCGIIFIHPQPTPEELQLLYSEEYFKEDFRCGHAGSYFDEQTQKAIVDEALLDRMGAEKRHGRFLEIGCAGGAFLNAARRRGYDVVGVEFSEDAVTYARSTFNLLVVQGDLTSARFERNGFDIVFLGDVLEHLPNPLRTLQEIYCIMRVEGLLVILCPTQTNTLFSRLGFTIYGVLGKKATVHLPPYHLFEYRPKSLASLLGKCGFTVTHTCVTAMRPAEIMLRGSRMHKLGKKFFQYPNVLVTWLFDIFGDRTEVFATKMQE